MYLDCSKYLVIEGMTDTVRLQAYDITVTDEQFIRLGILTDEPYSRQHVLYFLAPGLMSSKNSNLVPAGIGERRLIFIGSHIDVLSAGISLQLRKSLQGLVRLRG